MLLLGRRDAAPPSRGAVRLCESVGQLRAFTTGARVLLGSLSRALMRLLSRAERAAMFRLTTLQVGSGARCARHPSLEASLRARGSIEGERPTIMGLPIGAALWAASRAAAPTASSSSVREPS